MDVNGFAPDIRNSPAANGFGERFGKGRCPAPGRFPPIPPTRRCAP
ncbi:hypothetical protein L839_4576 [Mycobacterium avium MAV_120809_2495]|nr:hypothetical protein L839_4576 [Mycobacterium avium MAV_120809_2495]